MSACEGGPDVHDCLIADTAAAVERCDRAARAAEAEAAYKRMVKARIDRAMLNRVITAIAVETGQTPRQVRERLQAGGMVSE